MCWRLFNLEPFLMICSHSFGLLEVCSLCCSLLYLIEENIPFFNRCGKNKKDIIWSKYLVYTVRCCIWPKRISLFLMVSIWTPILRDKVLFLASGLCFGHSVSMWLDFFAAFSILAGCSFCSSHPLSSAWFLILRLLK